MFPSSFSPPTEWRTSTFAPKLTLKRQNLFTCAWCLPVYGAASSYNVLCQVQVLNVAFICCICPCDLCVLRLVKLATQGCKRNLSPTDNKGIKWIYLSVYLSYFDCCCWCCCAHRTELPPANQCRAPGGGGGERGAPANQRRAEGGGGGGGAVRANGPGRTELRPHSSSVEAPSEQQRRILSVRAGSWTSDWGWGCLSHTTHLHPEAQSHFHLTVIHEILQAYLQVLRRLLLNLLCQRLNWTDCFCCALLWDFFLSLPFSSDLLGWDKKKSETANFFLFCSNLNKTRSQTRKIIKKRERESIYITGAVLYGWLHLPVSLPLCVPGTSIKLHTPPLFWDQPTQQPSFNLVFGVKRIKFYNMSPELEENSQGKLCRCLM